MPLPTSIPETAPDAFRRVLATAQNVSSNLRGVLNLLNTPDATIYMDNLVGLYMSLNNSQNVGRSIQGIEGLGDYAKTVMNDPNYDIDVAFFTSVIACKAVTDWLLANMPGDGAGGFVKWKKQTDGTIKDITLTPADIQPLGALIETALATFS
jgi:hypothetical protein